MFKPGDKVICIKKDIFFENLIVGKIYTIENVYGDDTISTPELYYTYPSYCFISLKEYRKQKLQKICLSQEIE